MEIVLKVQKFCWANFFMIEMFIFAAFTQNVAFE